VAIYYRFESDLTGCCLSGYFYTCRSSIRMGGERFVVSLQYSKKIHEH
jgi:hypothetical protein